MHYSDFIVQTCTEISKENENYGSNVVEGKKEKVMDNIVTIESDSDTQEINEKI